MEKEVQVEMRKELLKSSRNRIILTTFVFLFIIIIVFSILVIRNIKSSLNRYIYSSEEEMLNDLRGTWVSYFVDTRIIGSSYYTFNDDYTMVQNDYDDAGNIEYSNTYTFVLNPEKGIVYVKDKECDLYNYKGEQYFRQYITTDEPTMLWKRVE